MRLASSMLAQLFIRLQKKLLLLEQLSCFLYIYLHYPHHPVLTLQYIPHPSSILYFPFVLEQSLFYFYDAKSGRFSGHVWFSRVCVCVGGEGVIDGVMWSWNLLMTFRPFSDSGTLVLRTFNPNLLSRVICPSPWSPVLDNEPRENVSFNFLTINNTHRKKSEADATFVSGPENTKKIKY